MFRLCFQKYRIIVINTNINEKKKKKMSKRGRQPKKMPGTFPILSNQGICECLNELHMNVDENNLKQPKRTMMLGIYESLVELLMGVSRDDTTQPHFAAVDVLEHQQLHENSVGEIMFIKSL